MINYTVVPGDSISRIILREFAIDNTLPVGVLDCLIRYVSIINGKNLDLYDNISSGKKEDPDTIKVGDILKLPSNITEAYKDPIFQAVNNGACKNLVNMSSAEQPASEPITAPVKLKLWPVYAGLGLLALLLLTRKKSKKRK